MKQLIGDVSNGIRPYLGLSVSDEATRIPAAFETDRPIAVVCGEETDYLLKTLRSHFPNPIIHRFKGMQKDDEKKIRDSIGVEHVGLAFGMDSNVSGGETYQDQHFIFVQLTQAYGMYLELDRRKRPNYASYYGIGAGSIPCVAEECYIRLYNNSNPLVKNEDDCEVDVPPAFLSYVAKMQQNLDTMAEQYSLPEETISLELDMLGAEFGRSHRRPFSSGMISPFDTLPVDIVASYSSEKPDSQWRSPIANPEPIMTTIQGIKNAACMELAQITRKRK